MTIYSNIPATTLPTAKATLAPRLNETVLSASELELDVELEDVPLIWMALAWKAAKVFALDSLALMEKTCETERMIVSVRMESIESDRRR